MKIEEFYCDICKGKISGEIIQFSLLNESYDICKNCSEELENKIEELEKQKISDLPF